MPLTEFQRPTYQGYDILDMTTLTARPDHEDSGIAAFPEHVLLLLREEWQPGTFSWGIAWLMHDVEGGRWGQRMFTSGPSPTNGNAERRRIRDIKEEITGVMH